MVMKPSHFAMGHPDSHTVLPLHVSLPPIFAVPCRLAWTSRCDMLQAVHGLSGTHA